MTRMNIASLLILFTSTSSYAMHGFYIGGGVGPQSTDFEQRATIKVFPPGATMIDANVKDKTHLSGAGSFGTAFLGYGWNRDRYYLAGEVNANLNSAEFKSSNQEMVHHTFSSTKYKIQHSYGISLLPGYFVMDPTLIYARIGYANGNFKIASTDTSIGSHRFHLNGFRYGVGIAQAFTQHISARMDYSNINYSSTKFRVVDGPATKTTRISPNTNQVEFDLIYNFV